MITITQALILSICVEVTLLVVMLLVLSDIKEKENKKLALAPIQYYRITTEMKLNLKHQHDLKENSEELNSINIDLTELVIL